MHILAKEQATRDDELPPASFEDCLEELANIVESLESGDLGLNEALGQYEQGVKLLKQCHRQLEKAERRIELLSGFDAAGNAVTEPVGDESTLDRSERKEPQSRRPQAANGPKKGAKRSVSPRSDVDEGESLF